MFVWTAIDIHDQLETLLPFAKNIEQDLGFKNSAFTLPFHISLKISFEIDESIYQDLVNAIMDYYKTLSPFDIEVETIEVENNIVWIRMKENLMLTQIHEHLCNMLKAKFGILPHEFDLSFKFHTTLFLDEDKEKINLAYGRVKEIKIPALFHADNFIIGSSKSGAIGSYRVTDRITLD